MSAIDGLVRANAHYVTSFPGPLAGKPKLQLAVIACMDARLDLLGALGLEIGDAHLIRNAGGIPTDDVLRSLAISQRALGTREVAIFHHTQCGMQDFDDDAFRAELANESGRTPSWRVPGFTDVYRDIKNSARIVRDCPWLPYRRDVRGFVYDVSTGAITEVT